MGCYNKQKYIDIYRKMPDNQWCTAKELGVAPATMTAMVTRQLVERTETSPRQYRKANSEYARILAIVADYDIEFFGLYKPNATLGMLCYLDNERIVDYQGNIYDVANVYKVRVGENFLKFKDQNFDF